MEAPSSARRKKASFRDGAPDTSPLLLRSSWFCAHAPEGCQLALVLLSWTSFSLLFCMPCLVKGLVSRQNKMQDFLDFNSCGDHINARESPALDSFVPVISGLGENKDMEKFCMRGKHLCSNPHSLCFRSMVAGFASEKDKSHKYSDEGAATNSRNEQELGQVRTSKEILGQEHITENLTFGLINGRTTVSCFRSPSYDSNKKMSIQEYSDKIQLETSGESSSPNVAVRPSSMEWGSQPLLSPSVAYLTVFNTCNDTVLHIRKPFSTNPYFYAYGFEEAIIAPGETVSIAFVFLPRMSGLATGHLILQTSSGGFLIRAQGEGVESPYRIHPITGLSAFSGSILHDNITLYNPFDGVIFVEEVSARISSSKLSSLQPTGVVCKADVAFAAGNHNFLLNADNWFEFGKDLTDISLLGIRPSGGWEITPHLSSTIMEIDISTHIEGKVLGALCILLKNSFQDTRETVIVPLEALIVKNEGKDPCIYPMPKDPIFDMQREEEQKVIVALSLKNDGSEVIKLENVCECSENGKLLDIEFLQGLVLLPGTVTYMAMVTYKVNGRTNPCKANEVQLSSLCLDCRLLVVTNSTQMPQVELPCQDLLLNNDSVGQSHVSTTGISERYFCLSTALIGQRESVNEKNLFQSSYTASPGARTGKTLEFTSDADDLFLKDWKLQGTSENFSVLVKSELWYPMVQIGMKSSEWVHVTNPSDQPVVMQLILSSEVISAQCKNDGEIWESWELNHYYWTVTGLLTKATDDYRNQYTEVFFLPENGITEAYVHPHGSASFGPILFQPSKRCVWMSSVFIKNNLSGVEWFPLQGAGGSGALTFLEGLEPVQSLHFNINIPTPTSTIGVMQFCSNQVFHRAVMKAACIKPVLKILLARNTGDIPLEVNAIKVAGNACGTNVFKILPCDRFFLAPGESTELLVSYYTDFSAAVVSQDLQLAMSSGIFVIPLKANLPGYMVALCQRSFFWLALVKVIFLIFLAASFMVFWRFVTQETTKLDLNQQSQGKQLAIAEASKIAGLTHGNPVKQRSTIVSGAPEVECARVKFSSFQYKGRKEQDTAASLAKAGKHVCKATGPSNFHEGLEKDYILSHSKCEDMKWSDDSEHTDLIDSDMVRGESGDKFGCSEVSDTPKCSFPFAVPNSGYQQVKWPHDSNNEKLSKSGFNGNKSIENIRSSEPSDAQAFFTPNIIPGLLNSREDSSPPDVPSNVLLSKVAPYSRNSLTVKLEKEKEKGRRRRKKSVAMTMKQDVSSSQSGNSTPSSPASPLTPVGSSGFSSPIVKTASQSNLMPSNPLRVNDFKQDMESAGYQYMCYKFHRKMPQGKGTDTSNGGFVADVCDLHLSEFCVSKMFDESSKKTSFPKILCEKEASSSKATFKPKYAGKSAVVNGDWVTVAKQSAGMTLNNSKGIHLDKSGIDSPLKMARPLLTTSATFPRSRRREPNSGWSLPVLVEMKETIVSSPSAPSLVSTSAIAPHARAPGTKLTKSNSVQAENNTHLSSESIEQDSTYDIWGNHFTEFPLTSSSNTSSMTTALPSTSMLPSSQEYSQSLFAKFAPKSHLDKAFSPSLSSNTSEFFHVFLCD